jgi:hypothetical protein
VIISCLFRQIYLDNCIRTKGYLKLMYSRRTSDTLTLFRN